MSRRIPVRRTDLGTIVLHWTLVGLLVVSVVTGLRIAADAPDADAIRAIAILLPSSNIWFLHILAGIGVMMVVAAYPIYMRSSGLMQRIRLGGDRLSKIVEAPWTAINIALYWVLFTLLAILVISGILLHRGFGGSIVEIHLFATWLVLLYTPAHVAVHLAYGGGAQLMRVFRSSGGSRWRIGALTAGGAAIVAGGWFAVDRMSRDVLKITYVGSPPSITGDLSDAAWRSAIPLVVRTQQGGNLNDTGESTVEVRAVHDGVNAYFAFTWEDPTRSVAHFPLVKADDGWHVLMFESQAGVDGLKVASQARHQSPVFEGSYAEDKFSVMLAPHEKPFGPGAFHPGQRPLADRPPSSSGRGLHYTTDGSFVDAWLWHASVGSMPGRCEADHIGGPQPFSPAQMAGGAPYKGGIYGESGRGVITENFRPLAVQPVGPVTPLRLPINLSATQAIMGRLSLDTDQGEAETSRWAMTDAESVPYSTPLDAVIPVGTIIPGLLLPQAIPVDNADVLCAAKWAANRWTLTARRRLDTGRTSDVPIRKGTYMFVAVFDHTVARHTRHIRPIRLEVRP